MKNVYICYAGYDYNTALHITNILENNDETMIVSRTDLNEDIESAYERIAHANLFVYLISQEALDDTFWRKQFDHAVKIGIPSQGLIVRHPEGIIPSPGGLYPIDLTKGFTQASLKRLHQVLNELPPTTRSEPRINFFVVLVVVVLVIGIVTYFFWGSKDNDSDITQISTNTMIPTRQVLNSTATETRINIPSDTATLTETATSIASPTSTPSATDEPTDTMVPPSLTSTQNSNTSLEITEKPDISTSTISASDTPLITNTVTNTPSATSTHTDVPTATMTSTNTPTFTFTSTPTFTSTYTSTPTATLTVTPSPTLTYTPSKTATPTVTPTIDPNSVVCVGAPISRLLVNEYAEVIHFDGISVRDEPGLTSQWIMYLPVASEVFLIDGPVCEDQFRWWEIEVEDDETGWVAEGDIVYYYLELIPSPTPTLTRTYTIIPE